MQFSLIVCIAKGPFHTGGPIGSACQFFRWTQLNSPLWIGWCQTCVHWHPPTSDPVRYKQMDGDPFPIRLADRMVWKDRQSIDIRLPIEESGLRPLWMSRHGLAIRLLSGDHRTDSPLSRQTLVEPALCVRGQIVFPLFLDRTSIRFLSLSVPLIGRFTLSIKLVIH